MSNIIPQYINDRFETLNAYIRNLYKAFVSFTANFFVDASSNINISGSTIQLSPQNNQINLSNNNLFIKWGSGVPSVSATTGCLYIDTNSGNLYVYTTSWKLIPHS